MNILVINCSPVKNGATAEIVRLVAEYTGKDNTVKTVCIDDYDIKMCRGCRSCHTTAKCIQNDDVTKLMKEYEWADKIVSVSPSYWADIPGQFKVFIDRCTPWCNTHEPHATIPEGKKGYTIALRTGPSMPECERIISSIEHFYGHLEIEASGSLGLCSVEYKEDVEARVDEIKDFCEKIINKEEEIFIELKDTEWPLEYIDHDRQIARAIVFDDDGYFYFVRANRDDDFGKATLIETAGGGVETGEDLHTAIQRELKEELGVDVEIVSKLGVVSDYYNLIHRHNINNYYLCRITRFGEKKLTQEEVEDFKLSTLKLKYEEAVKEYEKCSGTKLGRLVANREFPVLKCAKEIVESL